MRIIFYTLIVMSFCVLDMAVATAQDTNIVKGNFYDNTRDRNIPYKLYKPANALEPLPIVIFSHGLGGSTEAAPYLGQALAQNGYYAFFIQHSGTDKSIWEGKKKSNIKESFLKSKRDMTSAIDRFKDIPFVINQLEVLNNGDGELKGKLDLNNIGMAGHSYGARSTMTVSGLKIGRANTRFKDSRIKASVVLSPNVSDKYANADKTALEDQYSDIYIPMLHVTGTKDGMSMLGKKSDFDPKTRLLPYKSIKATNQYLLVFDGAEHSDFGGSKKAIGKTARVQNKTAEAVVLFFNSYLKNDLNSKKNLKENFYKGLLSTDRFEYK